MSIKLDDLDLSAVKGQLSMGLRSQTRQRDQDRNNR